MSSLFYLPTALDLGGPVAKYRANVEALKTLRLLRQSGSTATPEQQDALSRYTGWGDSAVLKQARHVEKYTHSEYVTQKPNAEMSELVSESEWESILGSSINAHYTAIDVIRAVWSGVERLFPSQENLSVLEPSCGVGHFIGAAPQGLRERFKRPVLVELDPLTAEIARHLYPEAEVACSGFERTFRNASGQRTLRNFFDVSITNVPFGKVRVADPGMSPKAATSSLHNYFVTRMIELTRPGGYVVAVTSRFSLDGVTTAVPCREAWAKTARLELSVRLPCDAFKANAGTEVVTDILFLRRLHEGESGNAEEWVRSEDLSVTGTEKKYAYALDDGTEAHYGAVGSRYREIEASLTVPVRVNRWYHAHPQHILGRQTLSGSMYANKSSYGELSVDGSLADDKPLDKSTKHARRSSYEEERARNLRGRYNVESDGDTISKLREALSSLSPAQESAPSCADGAPVVLPEKTEYVPQTELQRRWYAVYKEAKAVIQLQVGRCSDEELEAAQAWLRTRYDSASAYVGKYGAGRASSPEVVKAFADRPDIHSFLLALEKSDGSREAIFTRRTVFPAPALASSTDPVDVLYQCMDRLGRVDVSWIGEACGTDRMSVIERLGERIYKDPESGSWVLREEYLSGNVRRKLRVAREASRRDSYYDRNVPALEGVQPKDLGIEDVSISLKSPWVPASVLTEFVYDAILEQPDWRRGSDVVHLVGGSWVLDWSGYSWDGLEVVRGKTTARAGMGWLLQCGLDGKTPLVYDEYEEAGKKVRRLNQEQSVLAQAKLEEIQKSYQTWVWKDADRAATVLECYNDRFNCFAPRIWDGSFLTFPGMNSDVSLRKLQTDGVARVLFADKRNHPCFIWATGDGKTFGCIAAVEKRLQLGLSRKAVICVPKHLVPQWADDYRRLFPGRSDELLTAGKDSLTKKERGTFLSRAATGGYRVVIISHTQLKAIPVTDETFNAVVREQLAQLEAEIADQESVDDSRSNVTLKRLQSMKKSLEARIKERADRTAKDSDKTITWEELGFDLLVGDEAQAWKNLQLVTRMGNVSGVRTGSSQISQDFLVKLRHLQRGGGLSLLATATPIANSLAEAYVFAYYQQHEQLQEQGIDSPDAFFGAFTRTYASVELEPSCASYRMVSRLEFGNIPELVWMLRQSWHASKPGDSGVVLPELATGREIISQTPGSEALKEYVQDIAERVRLIRQGHVEPKDDNMLKVCSDGRWASLVNGPPDGEIRDTKLDRVVENVWTHYQETSEQRGAQIVFCDLGTPTGEREAEPDPESSEAPAEEGFTREALVEQSRVYEYIRQCLIRSGVPRMEIEFLQDHQGDPVKLRELYRRVNAGDVRVLLGSAPTGMNVQERLIALHHVDPVWRPDWKTQRDGRILRQGNRFSRVFIYLYLTEGSFDAYMWGLVRAKLRVIEQITHGDPTVRKLDGDVGDMVLRASEIQAIASGNPAVLQFVAVQTEMTKLSALRGEYEHNRTRMERTLIWAPVEIKRLEQVAEEHRKVAALWHENRSTEWSVRVLGRKYDDKKAAGEALIGCVSALKEDAVVGYYRGFEMTVYTFGQNLCVNLSAPGSQYRYSANMRTPTGVWQSIDGVMNREPESRAQFAESRVQDLKRELVSIARELPKPWDREAEYARTYSRYRNLAKTLAGDGITVSEFPAPSTPWEEQEPGPVPEKEGPAVRRIRRERGSRVDHESQLLLF